ncbi:MAG TPA: LLM class flavin-dependent oxidoreductase, partial [Allosphingosinicella sp.]|nr:LLM class flavin-dependent oxidoreductase [Allosphingosinicella sp.]
MIPLSVLDLAPIAEGSDAGQALRGARELARHAERLGYRRFWMAEHHSMPGIASAATAVALAFVAEGTSRIRIGAGGIMLPNHSPLQVAEQFGTLASLHPGRIDLGVGRAPGTDQAAAYAMRRNLASDPDRFPSDVVELIDYFRPASPDRKVRAIPGEGLDVPVWILGSSLFGAQLAALLGLPYAFASHFAPAQMMEAIQLYRDRFRPSAQLAAPHVMLAANVIVADEDEQARRLFTSTQRSFIDGAFRRRRTLLQPPIDSIEDYWHPHEKAQLESMLSCSFIGS